MNNLVIDILPFLIPALIAGAAGLIGWVHNLRTRVAILEKLTESLQKRMDSHSKKQDEILDKMNSMDRELMKQMGTLQAELQGLSILLRYSDSIYSIGRADEKDK